MNETIQKNEPASATLCKACGLCCTGHLFVNAEFTLPEVETTRALGLNVLQDNPETPVFSLPCPLWQEHCTIYTHPQKPSICGDFKCKLLREVEEGQQLLDTALMVVHQTKQLIQELDGQVFAGQINNFRKHLFEYVHQIEQSPSQTEPENIFRLKAGALLVLYAQRFGVKGLFNRPEQETPAQE